MAFNEAKQFVDEVSALIHPSRAQQYNKSDKSKFAELFDDFDEDKNGFLSKQEMSVFIKKVFKKKKGVIDYENSCSTPMPKQSSNLVSPEKSRTSNVEENGVRDLKY